MVPAVAVGSDRTDVVAKADKHIVRHGQQLEALVAKNLADQRGTLAGRTLMLAAEPDRSRLVEIHVPDRQLVQRRGQFVLLDQVAGQPVDEDQRGLHGRQVELGAAEIGMRLDAAIADRQRAAVRQEEQFVGADAMGRELAHALKAVRGVVDADHARGGVEIVLGRVEQRAVGRKGAVAEKMAPGQALDGLGLASPGVVEDDGKGAGLTGKDDRAAADGIEGDVVSALRQLDRVQ